MAVLATFSIRESRGAAVVMMKSVEDGQRDDVPGEFRAPVNWLPSTGTKHSD